MLRRCLPRRYWFFDQWRKEMTEGLHHKETVVSPTYTRLSQELEGISKDTPDSELTPFQQALKRAVTPISDALPVPRSIDPCYLSVNGEPVPQSFKFLPNNRYYEHVVNSHLPWKLHPFEKLISPHPSGYMEPLGVVPGNEAMPYSMMRTPIGKLPIYMKYRRGFTRVSVQILNINGDKVALMEDLRLLFPNKRVMLRQDRVEIFAASFDVARVLQHYLFAIGM
eukprot:Sspe_Gene.75656::Locus_47266_Transcript_1_2_Confidence_0.667_Length_819::g.75656::m.75656